MSIIMKKIDVFEPFEHLALRVCHNNLIVIFFDIYNDNVWIDF